MKILATQTMTDVIIKELRSELAGRFDPNSPSYIGNNLGRYEIEKGLMTNVSSLSEFEADLNSFRDDIQRSLESGWSKSDIKLFLKQTEELNPDLSEEIALRRMNEINARYKHKFGEKV